MESLNVRDENVVNGNNLKGSGDERANVKGYSEFNTKTTKIRRKCNMRGRNSSKGRKELGVSCGKLKIVREY